MINITAKNFELSEGLKSHIKEKFQTLERHTHNIISTNFVLEIDHPNNNENKYVAEGHIKIKDKTVNAKSCSEDMYQSIDDMMKKIDKQIQKHENKKQEKQRNKARVGSPTI